MALNRHEDKKVDLSMFVLDVLRYDIEQVDSIVRLLNDDGCIGWRHLWPMDFTTKDIQPKLKELVQKRLVDVYKRNHGNSELVPVEFDSIDVDTNLNEYWYRLTDAGREVWDRWKPPSDEDR